MIMIDFNGKTGICFAHLARTCTEVEFHLLETINSELETL